jgi:F-type H+-transporting ATPase subunit a
MQAKTYRSITYFCLFLVILLVSFSKPALSENDAESGQKKKGFNAGEMIIEHIVDAHEWHIAEIGNTSIIIPLPVILIDDGRIVTFMSSRLHHGAETYQGYKLETEGNHKGKIVKVDENNKEIETATLPLDFSITKNVLSLFISVFLLTWIFLSMARKYKRQNNDAPKGLQSMIEPLILFIRDDIAKSSIGEKRYERYMPFLLTVFFFIFFNNLLGLVPFFPGGANLTGNISVTLVIALFTFIITTFSGNKHYWKEIYNAPGVPWWLKIPIPLMPLVEVIGIITKPFVLMVRLFANITAGHIIGLGFISLIFIFGAISQGAGYGFSVISVFFYIFMGLLELLVAFIQAYVFTLLSALYFGMASAEHHETAH